MTLEQQVGMFIHLKPSSKTILRGLSPFTREKTPSFFVDVEKQQWHDFSSGLSGDQADFMRYLAEFQAKT